MQKINSFGVRQLRSFGKDLSLIPIRPINILVGKNSCGKSTFLRTFPLLRQSIQSNTKSPILWFGGLVDFGDFDSALNDKGDAISFDFDATLDVEDQNYIWEFESLGEGRGGRARGNLIPTQISITISKEGSNKLKTKLEFSIFSSRIELVYSGDDVESACAHNISCDKRFDFSLKVIAGHGALFPLDLIGFREKTSKDARSEGLEVTDPLQEESIEYLTAFIANYHHASKSKSGIIDKIESLPLCFGEHLEKNLIAAFSKEKFFVKNFESNRKEISEVVSTLLLARDFRGILQAADSLFKGFYSGVRYQGPLRAAGERFYRYQDLRVDEVDHTGGNLPMVINSLEKHKQRELSKWILENFGFELSLSAKGMHYELLVKEDGDSEFHNISDMGFGYSQILPVIVSIWLEFLSNIKTRRMFFSRNRGVRVIVLEQPELHLHPALQYKFGLAMAKVIGQARKKDLYFVVETHSKHLIDAIGESIREETIDQSLVNIATFEKRSNGITRTEISGFDSKGYLINWPIGFLSPEYDY